MRKTLVILLMLVHLTGNTEVGQLFRVPQLITHFFQHHRQDPGISFGEFIVMHYLGDDGTTADDDTDKELPCRNTGHNTIALSFSPMVNEIPFSELFLLNSPDYNSRLLSGITSKHVVLILQPPRIA
jgi:hypothetical protein